MQARWTNSALEVLFLNDIRYINSRFSYLLTYWQQLYSLLPQWLQSPNHGSVTVN